MPNTRNRVLAAAPSAAPAAGAFAPMAGLLGVAFLLLPFVPDEKLFRPKLLLIEVGFCLAAFLAASRAAWRGRFRAAVTPSLLALLAWASFLGARSAFGGNAALAGAEWRRALLCVAAFLAASRFLETVPARRSVWRAWGAGAALIALYGVLQRTGGIGPLEVPRLDRVAGTFGNPIFFGTYLSVSLFVVLGLWQAAESRTARAGWTAALAAVAASLVFSRTRAAWIGVAVALPVWLFLRLPRRRAWAIAAVFLAAGALFAWRARDVWSRDQAHLLIWRDSLKLWAAHPLWGVGPGEFHIHFPDAAGADLKAKWPPDKFIVNYAHNEFVQVLAETGLVGFLLWAGVFLFAGREFLARRRGLDGAARAAGDAAAAGALAGLAQAFFSVDMRFAISSAILYYLVGAAAAPAEGRSWGWRPTPARRAGGLLLAAWVFGVVAVERADGGWRANVLGLWQWREGRVVFHPEDMRAGLLTRLVHPYVAARRESRKAGFFDMRLLDPAKTIADLEALSRSYPDEATVCEKLGYAYAKEMRVQGADGPAVRADMADKAVAAYEKAVVLDPARPGPYNNLGNIFFTQGDHERALSWWERSVAVAPRQLDARLNLGKVYYLRGRLKEAAEQFRIVLETQPGNEEATVYLKKMVE